MPWEPRYLRGGELSLGIIEEKETVADCALEPCHHDPDCCSNDKVLFSQSHGTPIPGS